MSVLLPRGGSLLGTSVGTVLTSGIISFYSCLPIQSDDPGLDTLS